MADKIIEVGDEVTYTTFDRRFDRVVTGFVVEEIKNQVGDVGYHVYAALPNDDMAVIRLWANKGSVVPTGKKLAGPADRPGGDDVCEPVARTLTRERCDVADGTFWAEYRVRRLRPGDVDRMRASGAIGGRETSKAYVVESRYVRTEGDTRAEGEWTPWTFGDTVADAVKEGMGDTGYHEAKSLHPLHALHARHTTAVRRAHDEAFKAKQAMESAREAVETTRVDGNRAFAKKASGKGDAAAEKVKARMLKTWGPRLEAVRRDAAAAEAAYHEAQGRATLLAGREPELSDYPEVLAMYPGPTPATAAAGQKPYRSAGDLAAEYKAQGLDANRAWDQYVIDTILQPKCRTDQVDAREFKRLYGSS
jgi:hypothetical protein